MKLVNNVHSEFVEALKRGDRGSASLVAREAFMGDRAAELFARGLTLMLNGEAGSGVMCMLEMVDVAAEIHTPGAGS